MNPKNSKEEALISVIVPIYNSAAYLEQTFDCLRNQSYRNIEVILIDDGSTDASGRMCDEIAAEDPRFKVIHQKNAGVTAARNAGFELMTGDYLWLPDSDDYFHLDFLRIMYDAINSAPDIDVATCDAAKVFERDCDIRTPLQPSLRVVTQQEIIPNFFIEGAVPYASFAWNKLFRVSSSKGPIHYREYPPCEDADFTLRFFLSTQKAVVVDNVMYYFVQVPGSMSRGRLPREARLRSKTLSFIDCFEHLEAGQEEYRHIFLDIIYYYLLLWQAYAVESGSKLEYGLYRRTRWSHAKEYLLCGKIPLRRRIRCYLLCLSPHLTHFILRITGNLNRKESYKWSQKT